jgi:hypothetical protein
MNRALSPRLVHDQIRRPTLEVDSMQRRKSAYFRNALDLRDRVQVRIMRRRLKLSPGELDEVVRKAGNSIAAISKEATTTRTK